MIYQISDIVLHNGGNAKSVTTEQYASGQLLTRNDRKGGLFNILGDILQWGFLWHGPGRPMLQALCAIACWKRHLSCVVWSSSPLYSFLSPANSGCCDISGRSEYWIHSIKDSPWQPSGIVKSTIPNYFIVWNLLGTLFMRNIGLRPQTYWRSQYELNNCVPNFSAHFPIDVIAPTRELHK